jgi:hypothetical protein
LESQKYQLRYQLVETTFNQWQIFVSLVAPLQSQIKLDPMKKILLAIVSVFATGAMLSAQEMTGTTPYSYEYDVSDANVPTAVMPALDFVRIAQEDGVDQKNGIVQLYSRLHHVNLGLNNSGQWIELGNGHRLWRLKIQSTEALALNVAFKNFFAPDGAEMHIYSEDREHTIGAFTSINNKDHKRFATANVHDDVIFIEYFEPANVRGQGIIELDYVGHCYRNITSVTEEVGSRADDCEVGIACPEGDPYADERKGVVRISVVSNQGQGWCSGSLVNNTSNDCANYILTALHCGNTSTTANFNDYMFYFNYAQPNCGNGIAHANESVSGCTRRADSNDGGGSSGSDFLLVELDDIPSSYEPYWNGWNADGSGSPSGVSIHHPAGSPKFISTYANALTTTSWGAAGTHWRVNWVATQSGHGVTEGGSSGSPIFDNSSRIVGTLTGGSSYCNSVQAGGKNQPDMYGKMDKHWTSNPNAASEKLKEWLDPGNTGQLFMDGSSSPCANSISEEILDNAITVYPNPTEGIVNISFDEYKFENAAVLVYNSLGALIEQYNVKDGATQLEINLAAQPSGLYYVSIHSDGTTVTKKVSLVR